MGKGISRALIDEAGGIIIGVMVPTVFVNGSPIVVTGAPVTSHGGGPHAAAVMGVGSVKVFAGGLSVIREGDMASCSDMATGSTNVFAE